MLQKSMDQSDVVVLDQMLRISFVSLLKEAETMPTSEELAKKIHTKLMFNPEALCWIEKALLAHQK